MKLIVQHQLVGNTGSGGGKSCSCAGNRNTASGGAPVSRIPGTAGGRERGRERGGAAPFDSCMHSLIHPLARKGFPI